MWKGDEMEMGMATTVKDKTSEELGALLDRLRGEVRKLKGKDRQRARGLKSAIQKELKARRLIRKANKRAAKELIQDVQVSLPAVHQELSAEAWQRWEHLKSI
jgi:hypothetical protein